MGAESRSNIRNLMNAFARAAFTGHKYVISAYSGDIVETPRRQDIVDFDVLAPPRLSGPRFSDLEQAAACDPSVTLSDWIL